jgi:hypothetical protein
MRGPRTSARSPARRPAVARRSGFAGEQHALTLSLAGGQWSPAGIASRRRGAGRSSKCPWPALDSVSCASAGGCVAVGYHGAADRSTHALLPPRRTAPGRRDERRTAARGVDGLPAAGQRIVRRRLPLVRVLPFGRELHDGRQLHEEGPERRPGRRVPVGVRRDGREFDTGAPPAACRRRGDHDRLPSAWLLRRPVGRRAGLLVDLRLR